MNAAVLTGVCNTTGSIVEIGAAGDLTVQIGLMAAKAGRKHFVFDDRSEMCQAIEPRLPSSSVVNQKMAGLSVRASLVIVRSPLEREVIQAAVVANDVLMLCHKDRCDASAHYQRQCGDARFVSNSIDFSGWNLFDDDEDEFRVHNQDNIGLRELMDSSRRLQLFTAGGSSHDLEGQFRGPVFLVLSGPSLGQLDLGALGQRGVVTMAVNNAWGVIRPTMWTCVDPPQRFVDIGWRDPGIMKFVPISHLNSRLAYRDGDGLFRRSRLSPRQMSNVWYYQRSKVFRPERFFDEPGVNFGSPDRHVDSLGCVGHRNVMFAALRLLAYLGFRTIYLLGCDFGMESGGRNYAFDEATPELTVAHNNGQYAVARRRLESLVPYMRMIGLKVFNCNESSHLKVFPYKSYGDALDSATRKFCRKPDMRSWYKMEAVI